MTVRADDRITRATFGPGGNGDAFYADGKKATVEAPGWLKTQGLDAYEYQGGRGIRGSDASFRAIGRKAKEHGILMSVHAPYFISLSGIDPEKRLKSIDYISSTLHAADLLGADTIVIHCGGLQKQSRREALELAKDTLSKTLDSLGDRYPDISLGIETMGKVNQLGTLDEVIELCQLSERLSPVVDFGHLNARDGGGVFNTARDYGTVFERIAEALGSDKAQYLHCHFSMIEYTAMGEKQHLTFADTVYGPRFEPLMQAIADGGYCPRIICESAGTQAEDALTMKNAYLGLLNK